MVFRGCTLLMWILVFLPYTQGSIPTLPVVSSIGYRETVKHLMLGCKENTIAFEDQRSVISCAKSCKGRADCSAFGYRDDVVSENCLLISSDDDATAKLPVSYAEYIYFFSMEDELINALAANTISWMLFQRRINGEVDFYRNWTEYKEGFGDCQGEFWLGNDKLHELTKDGEYRLRIELEDNDGVMAAAEWDTFIVGDEQSKYQLTVGGFNGADPPADSMDFHNGMKFTTYDADNDLNLYENCGSTYHGGWWYRACHAANLNGKYGTVSYGEGIVWYDWKGHHYSLSASRMMIKKK